LKAGKKRGKNAKNDRVLRKKVKKSGEIEKKVKKRLKKMQVF